jgi:hypothetical protein
MKLACAAVVALGSFASFSAAPAFTQSSVIDIGTLGLGSSVLRAVNDHDEAVGWSEIVGAWGPKASVRIPVQGGVG